MSKIIETSLLLTKGGVLLSEGKVFLYRDSKKSGEYLNRQKFFWILIVGQIM